MVLLAVIGADKILSWTLGVDITWEAVMLSKVTALVVPNPKVVLDWEAFLVINLPDDKWANPSVEFDAPFWTILSLALPTANVPASPIPNIVFTSEGVLFTILLELDPPNKKLSVTVVTEFNLPFNWVWILEVTPSQWFNSVAVDVSVTPAILN